MPSKPCLCVSVFMANFVAFRSTLYNIKKSQKLTPTVYNVPDHQLEELKCFPFREFIHIIVRLSDPKLFLSRSKKKALPLHSPPRRFVRFRELSGRRRREDDSQARPQAWDARPQAPVLRRHRGNRAPCLLGFAPPSSSHSTEPRATRTNGASSSGDPTEFGGSGTTSVLSILLFWGGGSFDCSHCPRWRNCAGTELACSERCNSLSFHYPVEPFIFLCYQL
jgi:hypothetical protein